MKFFASFILWFFICISGRICGLLPRASWDEDRAEHLERLAVYSRCWTCCLGSCGCSPVRLVPWGSGKRGTGRGGNVTYSHQPSIILTESNRHTGTLHSSSPISSFFIRTIRSASHIFGAICSNHPSCIFCNWEDKWTAFLVTYAVDCFQ